MKETKLYTNFMLNGDGTYSLVSTGLHISADKLNSGQKACLYDNIVTAFEYATEEIQNRFIEDVILNSKVAHTKYPKVKLIKHVDTVEELLERDGGYNESNIDNLKNKSGKTKRPLETMSEFAKRSSKRKNNILEEFDIETEIEKFEKEPEPLPQDETWLIPTIINTLMQEAQGIKFYSTKQDIVLNDVALYLGNLFNKNITYQDSSFIVEQPCTEDEMQKIMETIEKQLHIKIEKTYDIPYLKSNQVESSSDSSIESTGRNSEDRKLDAETKEQESSS